jgi:CRP/FNR family transcriptional regulator
LDLFPLHRPELHRLLTTGDAALTNAMGTPRVFNAGMTIIAQGAASDLVYRVHSGWAARMRIVDGGERQMIVVYLPHDLAGIKSMLLRRQPDAIECLTDVTMQTIGHAELSRLAESNYAVALRLMFQLGEDERRLHNWVTALGIGDAEQRLAIMLLEFRGRLHRLGFVKDETFRLPLTQRQIGEHVGLTVVHVNRILRRFRDEGIVSLSQRLAKIHDPEKLGEIARPLLDVFEVESPAFSGGPLQN